MRGIISRLRSSLSIEEVKPGTEPKPRAAEGEQNVETVETWSVGDPVCVFSRRRGSWLRDGTVVRVDAGSKMPAGTVKVVYDDGNYAKWVPPAAFKAELRSADFRPGDAVCVFCRGMGLWVADGVVDEVLAEAAAVGANHSTMPVGSVKVTYASGSAAKWVPPHEFGKEVRMQEWNLDVDDDEHCSTAATEDGSPSAAPAPEPTDSCPASPDRRGAATEDPAAPATEEDLVGKLNVGDPVRVFGRSSGVWSRDGTVVRILEEATALKQGLQMPSGAVLVVYDDGNYAKWVPPAAFKAELRSADFKPGDAVSVFCRGMGLWVADGVVDEVLAEAAAVGSNLTMPAGSVKVTYASQSAAKWVPPEEFGTELRAQRRCCVNELLEQLSATMSKEHGAADAEAAEPPAESTDAPASESALSKRPSTFRRSFSRLSSVLGWAGEQPGDDATAEDDDDAFIVSADADVDIRVRGRYRRAGEHKDQPKYKNDRGAIMYWDGHWKMNVKDDALHWCFESKGEPGDAPPSGTWQPYRFYTKAATSGPRVTRAAEVELFSVSGVSGPGSAVNGRYAEAGTHNDRPKYTNRNGAIIFFDGYWKMNDKSDALAWRFSVKGATGPQPPAGEWAAHWSFGKEQAPAQLKMHREQGKIA